MDTSLNKSLCRAYPHAFAVPEKKVEALSHILLKVLMMISRWVEAITTWSGLFNSVDVSLMFFVQSYVMFDQVFWRAIAGQINRWRRNLLHLGPTSLDKMEPHKIPFLYNFSPHLVPPPLDWPEWIRVTGLLL